ncbi:AcrR family transcriptional regulator [Thermocatellispora tengchongensis]|uniref:AcrR family transcriptional regulator n=1 Tax=Thermocatellispora tengchongensis TaxID=1073253 RepID=A0A840P7G3_9ACTN|nr:TetR/AcrR family transcriptional regulator [Thermocatellispora tengchongensis]MBB5133853.1 AcrR family transcriptional regulator [Thermocatellispora tengchongensis]
MAPKDSNTPTGDRRVRRTQTALARALIQLVEERDLSRISVSDVADRAEVSRSAFYDHYRDVHELAEAACTAMIDALIESLPVPAPDSADPVQDATHSLTAFFASLAEHAGLYRSLLGPQGSARVTDHIRRRIAAAIHRAREATADHLPERAPSGSPHDVSAAFTAGAMIGVATDWLQRGCPHPPAEMAALTWPLLSALYGVEAGTRP